MYSVVYPISFVYVWTFFEHQVRDKKASPNVPVLSSFRQPEKFFLYQRG